MVLLAGCGGGSATTATRTPDQARVDRIVREALSTDDGTRLKHDADDSAEGTGGRPVCRLYPAGRVEAALRASGIDGVSGLHPHRNDSLNLSICQYGRGGVNVRILLDGAANATLRYFDQLSEAQQKFNPDPSLRPRTMQHVGDDATYGGSGAYWTRARDQLITIDNDRILRITVHVPGESEARRKAASARMARALFAMLPEERQG